MKTYFSALILMSGEGKRLGSALPKQFHTLGTTKVYQHTLEVFRESQLFQEIILVCHPEWIDSVREETALFPEVKVIPGGATRQASSWEGLKACHPNCNYVMIHDAVRPFVSQEIIRNNAQAVLKHQAVDTVIASADTLIMTDDGQTIASIPLRAQFRRGQTPQTFAYPIICEAHANTTRTNATDDCQLALDLGVPITLVDGSDENIKITTERDLAIADYFLQTNKTFN